MENRESLKTVVQSINTGQSYPALRLVQESPETAALISKLIAPQDKSGFNPRKPDTQNSLNQSQIQAISESTKQRTRDNENIIQLFPDIELAVQILVSSILSPKDMVKTDLIYKSKEPILPSELLLKLNTIAQSHLESYHGLRDELQDMLRDTLFNTGSYIKAIIPESIVDEIINQNKVVSTESLTDLFDAPKKIRHLGVLGNAGPTTNSTALESFFSTNVTTEYKPGVTTKDLAPTGLEIALEHLEVTDNFQMLKLPEVIKVANKQKLKSLVKTSKSLSLEAYNDKQPADKKLTAFELTGLTYKNNSPQSQTFLAIPSRLNSKRKTIGRPLVLKLPSESVIPVYIPGDESRHIGYFVLVDGDGNPVNRNSLDSSSEGLSGLMGLNNQSGGQGTSLSSMLIAKAKKNLGGNDAVPTIDRITKVYSNIVEQDLMERLSNGIYGSNVQVGNNEEIYRIMLARSLSSKFTRLIYLPAELATYFAFSYFPNGVGKSYLDGIKNLTSLRAILLFSKVMAQVKSAISLTHVGMTLDPNDPDPQKTIEIAQQEIVKMRQQYFPLGINSPVDLVDWIQRAGLEFSFEGHPGLPQTKFDFEAKTLQRDVPDSELDEMLRKQTYMAFGLSPETVDNGFNSEFATTVVANNILLSKRVVQLQNTFTPQLSEYGRKVILNDAVAMEELKGVLEENIGLVEKSLTDEEKATFTENKDEFLSGVVERFLENMEIDLPHPDITSLENQSKAYEEYEAALDKALDSWVSTQFMTTDLVGDASSNIDSIRSVIKAYYLRRWMADNGYMPELNDIVTANEEGKATIDIFDVNKNHMQGLLLSCLKYLKSIQPTVLASNADIAKMGIEPGEATSGGSSFDSGGGGGGDFGGMSFDSDLGGGMGDLGGGTDEIPPEGSSEDGKTNADGSPKTDEPEGGGAPDAT